MRTVVVGLGLQGHKRVAAGGKDIVAAVDPVADGAKYKRIEDVPLADFDAAMVSTPDDAKLPLIRYLLSNGKHVLVEKPLLAKDPAVFAELDALARSRRVTCYTAYNHRFEPNIAQIKPSLDQNSIGRVYLAKFHYGNGTARDFKNSPWRDRGTGVVSDLASHLLDLTNFFFGNQDGRSYSASCLNRFENNAYDHAILVSRGLPVIELEMSLICWKNTFTIDFFGELGSIHAFGLCKWGPTTLTIRKRVFPSGKPVEDVERFEGPDPTWVKEFEHFKALCQTGVTSLDNDRRIDSILHRIPEREESA